MRPKLLPSTRSLAGLLAVPLLISSCGAPGADVSDGSEDCVDEFDSATDYFPDRVEPSHAGNISFDYADHYVVVTVEEPSPGAAPESYVLHRCGTPAPEADDLDDVETAGGDSAEIPIIETPVESVFSGSTTHLPLFDELDQAPVITGVADASFVLTEAVNEQIDKGATVEYAAGGAIDQEAVVGAEPDLLMTGGIEEPDYASLREAGVPVIANAEWLESTPLGRAEWLLFASLLTGAEERATELFGEIESDYEETAELAVDADTVEVLPGQLTDGTWFMPAGDSYVAQLLRDAGGTYPWEDTDGSESIELDLEEVLSESRDTETWIASVDWETRADAEAEDERHSEFAAFDSGEVWTNNKATSPEGGNLYWDEGVLRPDLVLRDLVHVLHPDLLPDYETRYYRQLDDE